MRRIKFLRGPSSVDGNSISLGSLGSGSGWNIEPLGFGLRPSSFKNKWTLLYWDNLAILTFFGESVHNQHLQPTSGAVRLPADGSRQQLGFYFSNSGTLLQLQQWIYSYERQQFNTFPRI